VEEEIDEEGRPLPEPPLATAQQPAPHQPLDAAGEGLRQLIGGDARAQHAGPFGVDQAALEEEEVVLVQPPGRRSAAAPGAAVTGLGEDVEHGTVRFDVIERRLGQALERLARAGGSGVEPLQPSDELLPPLLDERAEQALLAGKVVVERAGRQTGPLGDLRHPRVGQPAGPQHALGGVEDGTPDHLGELPAQRLAGAQAWQWRTG
jgi:hypothetical protein